MIDLADIPKILYLTMDDVKAAGLSDEDFLNCVSDMFIQHSQSMVEMLPEQKVCPSPELSFRAFTGWVEKVKTTGVRWLADCTGNSRHGLHRTFGMIVLNDCDSGLPYAFMDSFYIMVKRIAATTAVSAKYLARRDSEVLGIIGAGAQERDDLRMLQLVLPKLNRVKIYDVRPNAAESYARTMADEFRGEIIPCGTVEEAVRDVDVLLDGVAAVVVKSLKQQVRDCWLPSQGLFMAPLAPLTIYERDTIGRMDKITTDDLAQLSSLSGAGNMPYGIPEIYALQGEIVSGQKAGRESENENIAALNLGIPVHDLYIGRKIFEVASEKGIGVWLEPLTW